MTTMPTIRMSHRPSCRRICNVRASSEVPLGDLRCFGERGKASKEERKKLESFGVCCFCPKEKAYMKPLSRSFLFVGLAELII